MPEVAISLGSNVGDRTANLGKALALTSKSLSTIAVSSAYETEPMYLEDQPWFVNCALVARTEMAPRPLLRYLQDVEAEIGRRRVVRYGPRIIDIDIVLYDRLIVSEPGLEIPHPRLAERAFVLVPLAEVPRPRRPRLGEDRLPASRGP